MALLISGFEGLGDADFDVYRQACWSSNVHNLDRMRTKARVVALAERMRAAVADVGLVAGASSEIPSVWNGRTVKDQWAYLLRPEAARKQLQPVMARSTDLAAKVKDPAEHHQHLVLALRLDHEGLEVGLRLHAHATVDLANLEGHAQVDPAGLEAALADIGALVLSDGRPVSAAGLLASVRSVREASGTAEGPWVVVARRVPRAEVVAAGVGLADQVVATALSLLPLLHFAAWTPENDHVGVRQQAAALAEEVEQKREVAEAEHKAAELERETRRHEARERTEAQVAELRAWKSGLRVRREEQQVERAQREAEERQHREIQEAERAARQAERDAAHAAEQALRAAEQAARAADLAERVANARRDAQEAMKAAEARKAAQEARAAAPAEARRPEGARPEGGRPQGPRPEGSRPQGPRPEGGRPQGPRTEGGRPQGRPEGGRPQGRPEGGRPEGGRPQGPRPEGGRPQADRPQGDRPEGPRPEETRKAPEAAPERRALAVGDRCRLDRGLLAGKEGVVRSIDAKKGYYQVRVGVLDVNIAFADATPLT